MKKNKAISIRIIFVLIVVLLIVITFLLNGVALVLSNRYDLTADLTANARYEIGDETKKVLESLTQSITIDVLTSEDSFDGDSYLVQVKQILEHYPRCSEWVTLNYIDYASDPSYAAGHADLTLSEGDIIVSGNGKVRQLTMTSLFNYAYTSSGSLTIESSRAEEALTGAILNVLSTRDIKIAVLTGSGEQEMANFTALLVNNNYQLENAVIATDDLSGYDALLLFAPQTDLSEDDVRSLEEYLYNNGSYGKTLFYAASVTQPALPNLETFLSEWGVSVGDGAVFETTASRTYQYQPYYPIADYASETWQDMLVDSSTPILMPLSRPLEVLFDARDGQYTETLLSFGESAGVRPPDASDSFTSDDAQTWGPIPAMVLATRRVYENGQLAKQSNIIVTGSVSMLDELCLQNTSLANSTYLLNLFGELTDKEETISISPKSLSGKTLGITTAQVSTLGVILGGIVPLCILAAGIGVWLYRRHK